MGATRRRIVSFVPTGEMCWEGSLSCEYDPCTFYFEGGDRSTIWESYSQHKPKSVYPAARNLCKPNLPVLVCKSDCPGPNSNAPCACLKLRLQPRAIKICRLLFPHKISLSWAVQKHNQPNDLGGPTDKCIAGCFGGILFVDGANGNQWATHFGSHPI